MKGHRSHGVVALTFPTVPACEEVEYELLLEVVTREVTAKQVLVAPTQARVRVAEIIFGTAGAPL